MYIHVVQPGDTIYTIANSYGVSPERLSPENDLIDPNNFTIGEALVIIRPSQTYIVQEGDSFESIAKAQGVEVDDSEIIQLAKAFGVAPIMFLTVSSEETNVDTDKNII